MVLLKIDAFVSEMTAESGVNYDTQGVPYKTVVIIPFKRCPESADPCSIIQDDKTVRLEGAQMSAKVFEIYSDLMGNPGVVLHRNNPLAEEMEVEPRYSMWDQLCEDMDRDARFPQDSQSQYQHVVSWQDPNAVTEVLDVCRRSNGKPGTIREVKERENLLWLLSTSGYGGGESLDIPRTVAMKLMEDGAFDHLFFRENDSKIPSRNELQHAIHRNANLAIQIAIVGSILQEDGTWRRGEHPRLKDRGTMFETCRGCDRADPFPFLMPIMKGAPWRPGCHYKDPNATV